MLHLAVVFVLWNKVIKYMTTGDDVIYASSRRKKGQFRLLYAYIT